MGDLESVLEDLDSVLGRSWELLGRSWVVLGVQESPSQGARRTTVGRSYHPPSKYVIWDPHSLALFQLEKGDGATGKREKYHREEGRV